MERTPPRSSARLMDTGLISSSIVAISSNSTMPIVSTPLDDGAPSIISVRNIKVADSAQISGQSKEDKPSNHNIEDIEKRLAMLEATLKVIQVQLRERYAQNELLRAALVGSSNSTAIYTSSAVTQSQSTQPAQLASTNFCTTPRPVISAAMTDNFRAVTTQQTNDTPSAVTNNASRRDVCERTVLVEPSK
ncbi:unnamed protein product, partial [Ceratitis capitata]